MLWSKGPWKTEASKMECSEEGAAGDDSKLCNPVFPSVSFVLLHFSTEHGMTYPWAIVSCLWSCLNMGSVTAWCSSRNRWFVYDMEPLIFSSRSCLEPRLWTRWFLVQGPAWNRIFCCCGQENRRIPPNTLWLFFFIFQSFYHNIGIIVLL